VALVNDAAARKNRPGQDALGQRITIAEKERVVVGAVGNIRHFGPETPSRQEAYVPLALERVRAATLVARTTRPPFEVLPAVKAAIRSINRDQHFTSDITTLDGYMDRLVGQRRFLMALTALLGCLGLVIATAGVYGVRSYVATQRTGEIGLRMALGATPGSRRSDRRPPPRVGDARWTVCGILNLPSADPSLVLPVRSRFASVRQLTARQFQESRRVARVCR
jgi:hypothetical protein